MTNFSPKHAFTLVAFFAACVIPSVALAHAGHTETAGLAEGAMHPISGLDHLVAMVSIGALAGIAGGKALWSIPSTFLVMMLAGAGAGWALPGFALVERGILVSLFVVAAMFVTRLRPPIPIVLALIGAFGSLHGYAHGAEIPAAADALLYALGFTLTTLALLGAGICAAVVAKRARAAARS